MAQEVTDLNGLVTIGRRGSRTVAALLVALVAAGCANDRVPERGVAPPAEEPVRTTRPWPTTTLPHLDGSLGLAASVRQFRENEATGVLQIQLVGGPDVAGVLSVDSVRLEWPGFAPVAATAGPVLVVARQRVDVPTPLGAAVCDGPGTPPAGDGVVVATVRPEGGAPVEVRAPLLDEAQVTLDRVHGKACVRQAVDRAVGLEYAPDWSRSDPDGLPTATGTLVVTRRSAREPIAVTGLDGSVLLNVSAGAPLPAEVDGSGVLRLPIEVVASGRCDGHALGESKQTYTFQVLVRIGDDDPVGADVVIPTDRRGVLAAMISDTCTLLGNTR